MRWREPGSETAPGGRGCCPQHPGMTARWQHSPGRLGYQLLPTCLLPPDRGPHLSDFNPFFSTHKTLFIIQTIPDHKNPAGCRPCPKWPGSFLSPCLLGGSLSILLPEKGTPETFLCSCMFHSSLLLLLLG